MDRHQIFPYINEAKGTKTTTRLGVLFAMVSFFMCAVCHAEEIIPFYDHCKQLPSASLVELGNDYLHNKKMRDSALVCFTVVTNRSNADSKESSAKVCIDAYIGEWHIYFFHFFNYSKSLECLFTAERLAKEKKLVRPDIYMDLGCTYQTMAEECNDTTLYRQALSFYKNAVELSFKNRDVLTLNITMTNLISTAHVLNNMNTVKAYWDRYLSMDMGKYSKLAEYNKLSYSEITHLNSGDYDKAIEDLRRQTEICKSDLSFFIRFLTLSYINIGSVCVKAGRFADAVGYLSEAERIAIAHDFKDAKLETYRMLSECYKRQGMPDQSMEYREKYFSIKDTLLNYHQLKSVSEMRFLSDIKKLDEELTDMKFRHKMLNTLFIVCVVVFFIVSGLLLVLYYKSRQVNKSHKLLYKKNVEMLRSEEKERSIRKKLGETQKDNTCDIENVDEIYDRILLVMENNDVVFSPDFTADTLASLVGFKQRIVSQVIRNKTGANFYSLLSNYRIKEVCKRFSDEENYSNLTIEAIAHSVGFKSRSNFCSTFKNITGLNPSEYIKMVKEGV